MSLGSLAGSAVAFGASLALARLYAPSEHGQFAIVSAVALVLTPIVSGRFEYALSIPSSDTDAYRLVKLGAAWAICVSGFATVLLLAPQLIDRLGGNSIDLPPLLWAAPMLALLTAWLNILSQYNVRHRMYGLVGARNASYPSLMAGAQLGLGVGGASAGGLVGGALVGRALTLVVFSKDIRNFREKLQHQAGLSYRDLMSRFWRFPTVLAASAVINTLGLQLPVLLVGAWYGDSAAGQFGMSQRTLSIPLLLIGAAIGQVYLSEMSRAMREGSGTALNLFDKSSVALTAAGLVIASVLMVLGPGIFATVFGRPWVVAGEIARAMSVSLAFQLVASPLSQVLIVYERYRMQFGWDLARLMAVVLVFIGARAAELELVTTIWILSGVTAVCYVVSWLLSRSTIVDSRGELSEP